MAEEGPGAGRETAETAAGGAIPSLAARLIRRSAEFALAPPGGRAPGPVGESDLETRLLGLIAQVHRTSRAGRDSRRDAHRLPPPLRHRPDSLSAADETTAGPGASEPADQSDLLLPTA